MIKYKIIGSYAHQAEELIAVYDTLDEAQIRMNEFLQNMSKDWTFYIKPEDMD